MGSGERRDSEREKKEYKTKILLVVVRIVSRWM